MPGAQIICAQGQYDFILTVKSWRVLSSDAHARQSMAEASFTSSHVECLVSPAKNMQRHVDADFFRYDPGMLNPQIGKSHFRSHRSDPYLRVHVERGQEQRNAGNRRNWIVLVMITMMILVNPRTAWDGFVGARGSFPCPSHVRCRYL